MIRSLSAILLAAGFNATASAQICLLDPIEPPCCPSPCPVVDLTRLPNLVSQVQSLQQLVASEQQMIGQVAAAGRGVGKSVSGLSPKAIGASWSFEKSSFQAGLGKDPVQIAHIVKATLFKSDDSPDQSMGLSQNRRRARMAALQDETIGALASSLAQTRAASEGRSFAAGPPSDSLRGDFAANSAARLSLLSDVIGLHQVTASLLSPVSLKASLNHDKVAAGADPATGGDSRP